MTAKIPDEVYNLFISPLILRKQRMSALVKWFASNYHLWLPDDILPLPTTSYSIAPLANSQFADALTDSLNTFNITIQAQRVWTWISERNLPHPDNFQLMAKVGEGWQKEFARIVLLILESGEPE